MIRVHTDALEAQVCTVTQRVSGLIHPTAGAAVAEFLNRHDRAVLPITDALVYQPGAPHPPAPTDPIAIASFYAIPKVKILWLRSGYFEAHDPLGYQTKRVAVYFDGYCIAGTLRLPRDARLSDHLELVTRHKPFQRLHDATITTAPPGPALDAGADLVTITSEVLVVNLKNAHGIAELLQQAKSPDKGAVLSNGASPGRS